MSWTDLWRRGVFVGGGVAWVLLLPWAAESKERENEYFQEKKIEFWRSTNFKLFCHVKGNSVYGCGF